MPMPPPKASTEGRRDRQVFHEMGQIVRALESEGPCNVRERRYDGTWHKLSPSEWESAPEIARFVDFEIDSWTPAEIVGRARGERLDIDRHEFRTAVKAATYHQFESHQTNDGEWELRIVGNEKAPTYQLLFQQSGADIKGTVLRVDGDEGTMVGRVEGTHFAMSHFSGDRPTTLTGELKPDGSIEITRGATKAVALRPAEARARKLPPPLDPATHARAKNPDEAFHFSFPDLNGRPVSEANFRGKPYIVFVDEPIEL